MTDETIQLALGIIAVGLIVLGQVGILFLLLCAFAIAVMGDDRVH